MLALITVDFQVIINSNLSFTFKQILRFQSFFRLHFDSQQLEKRKLLIFNVRELI